MTEQPTEPLPPTSRRRSRESSGRPGVRDRAAEVVALITIAAAPLALGAVHTGVLVALAGSGALALALLASGRRRIHVGVVPCVLLGMAAVAALQLLPLPATLLDVVAAPTAELHRFVLDPGAAWMPLSLDRPATARALARLLGLASALVVLQQAAGESRRARRRALIVVAGSGLLVTAIGFAHLAAGASQLFGVWGWSAPPALVTTLRNPNHLAAILNVTALTSLGLSASSASVRARLFWAAGFLGALAGSILVASRGGMLALAVGLLSFAVLARTARRAKSREEAAAPRLLVPGLIVAAALVALLVPVASPLVAQELSGLAHLDLSRESKLELFATAARALAANPWMGIGQGAFEVAHTRYLASPVAVSFTHVENEPLQALVELGVPAAALAIIGMLFAWVVCLRRGGASWVEAGAAAATTALLLHSFVDFNLEHAGGFVLVALLAHRPSERPSFRLPALAAAPVLLVVSVAGWAALPGLAADTERLSSLSNSTRSVTEVEAEVAAALRRRPADYLPSLVAGNRALAEPGKAREALRWVNRTLFLHPQLGDGHVLAGEALARLRRREQALLEFRTAASMGIPTMARVLARYPDAEAIEAAAPLEAGPAIDAAVLLEAADRHEDALGVLVRALAIAPHEPLLVEAAHRVYTRLGRDEAALQVAAELRRARPDWAHAWSHEAYSLARLGRGQEARGTYEAGLVACPGHVSLVHGWAAHEIDGGDPAGALRILERSIDRPSTRELAGLHGLRARARRAMGEFDTAREELRRALQLDPASVPWRLELSDLCLELGRLEEAEAELRGIPVDDSRVGQLRERLNALRGARRPQR